MNANRLLLLSFALACERGAEAPLVPILEVDPVVDEPPVDLCLDPALTWEGFAQPFLSNWCTSCHGVDLVGDARHGAPEGVDFNTLASTIPFAPRIQVRAVDSLTMPPTNAIAPDARARLGAWIACGMPGVDDPAPTLTFCDEPRFYDGSVTMSALPSGACDTWDSVTGTATLDADSVLLDCLCEVQGDLVVTGSGDLSVPELVTVGGEVSILNAPLTSFEAPYLVNVGGSITITDDLLLTSVNLSRVEVIGGGLVVARNPALVDFVSMQGVDTIGAGLQFEDLDALVELDAAPLATVVSGNISIAGNALLETLWLGQSLTEHSLAISITANPALTLVSGLEVLEHGGDLTFDRLDALQDLPIFDDLEDVDRLTITETGLTSLHGLDGLNIVRGTLEVSRNTELVDVSALQRVETVGGNMLLIDNPALPTSMADALIQAIGPTNVSGTIDITGNGPG